MNTRATDATASGIEIKICGLTSVEQAVKTAELGADAIGLVFFDKSPRNVNTALAKEISYAIQGICSSCGVFVNEDLDKLLKIIEETNIDLIQLHGEETEEYIQQVKATGKKVIKVLKEESFSKDANKYSADAFLLELGKGALPGGNAQSWDWQKAASFGTKHPYILAGGLSAENIIDAIARGKPKAVDISSAVEQTPGVKDLNIVKQFIDKVHTVASTSHNERIF